MSQAKDPEELKNRSQELQELWRQLQESVASKPSPFEGMTEEQIMADLKATRYQLWEEKFASSPRR